MAENRADAGSGRWWPALERWAVRRAMLVGHVLSAAERERYAAEFGLAAHRRVLGAGARRERIRRAAFDRSQRWTGRDDPDAIASLTIETPG